MSHPSSSSLVVLLVLAVTFSVTPAAAAGNRDVAYENARRDDLAKLDPSLVTVWDRANVAREAGRVADARAGFEEVVSKAPAFDAGHRRLCSVAASREDALTSCRHALKMRASWENESALAMVLMNEPSGRAEARRLLDSAEMKAASQSTVLAGQASLALDEQDAERFLRYADRLAYVAPNEPEAAIFGTIAALFRGDATAARASYDRAKANGLAPELAAKLEAGVVKLETAWTPARLAKTFGLTIAAWLLLLGALYGAGTMLSRATLRATAHATDAASVRNGDPIGGTRTLRRAYSLLLSFSSVFYYLSLPLVGALVLGAVGGVIYLCLAMGRVPVKLVLILVVVGLVSLWAILKGIYITLFPGKPSDPGEDVSLEAHPRLARLLSSVAARIGTRTVDRVFLTPGTDMAVYERGGPIQTARGKGERCLIMGAGLLRGMRVGSLKGVLAHEFGHFRNEDTAGGAMSLAVRRSMIQMIIALAQNGAAAAYNPAWIFATRFHDIFLRISQGASRLQEVLADRWAVIAYGSKPFVDGFEHVVARSVEHDARAQKTLSEVIEGNLALANFYTYEAQSPIDATELAESVREARERPADPFDSHPPPKDRVEAALALAIEHPPEEGDDEDAWHIFEEPAALEERLTGRICDAIAENHSFVIRRTPAPPTVDASP